MTTTDDKHYATIVPGSIEDLGANGIAFSTICCGDKGTTARHTIQHAHSMSYDELEMLIEREYLDREAERHAATSSHAAKLRTSEFVGQRRTAVAVAVEPVPDATGDCGCQK